MQKLSIFVQAFGSFSKKNQQVDTCDGTILTSLIRAPLTEETKTE